MSDASRPRSCVDQSVAVSSAIAVIALIFTYKFLGYRSVDDFLLWLVFTIIVFNIIFDVNYRVRQLGERLSQGSKAAFSKSEFIPFIRRVAFKLVAFYAIIGAIAFIYYLTVGFSRDFVLPHLRLVLSIWPFLSGLSVIYLIVTDICLTDKEDELYRLGRVLLFRMPWRVLQTERNYVLGIVVKLFFAPLMMSFAKEDLNWILSDQMLHFENAFDFYESLFHFIYTVDVLFGTVGYLAAFKLFGSEIRTVEHKVWGWLVCLICYPPFWQTTRNALLNYDNGFGWQLWLADNSVLFHIWGVILTLLLLIYVWATISFGIRFSNLTNRGILTNGPYRWVRHPAYLAKNISWWLISIPFVPSEGWSAAIRNCILLMIVNLIYFMRARAETLQLRADPEYRAYEEWIARHGLWARIKTSYAPIRERIRMAL